MGFKALTILAIFLLAVPMSLSSAESRTLAIDNHLYSFQPIEEGKLYLAVRNKVYFTENNGKSWSYALSSEYDPSEVLYLLKDGSILKLDTATSTSYKLNKHKWEEYKKTPTPRPLEVSGVYTIRKEIGKAKKPSEIFTNQLVTSAITIDATIITAPNETLPSFSVDANNPKFSWIPSDIKDVVITESTLSVDLLTLDLKLLRNSFVISTLDFREAACNLPSFPVGEQCFMVDINIYKDNYETKRDLINNWYPVTDSFYNPTCDTGVYNPSNCNILILRLSKTSLQELLNVYYQESFDAINIWAYVTPTTYGGVVPPKDEPLVPGDAPLA
mgnify:CR=1 FL=1